MQKLNDKDSSKKILEELKNEFSELVKQNENDNEEVINIKKSIKNIHHKLNEFEAKLTNTEDFKYPNYVSAQIETDEYNLKVRKKLIVKKMKKSKSFFRWLFNNNDM